MSDVKFYRSVVSGLSVVVGKPQSGEVAPETVRFSPFEERVRGEKVVVGYLETDNQRAIRALSEDSNVQEIKEKEYREATDVKNGAKAAVV